MRSKFAALTTQLKEKLVELKLLQTSKQEAEQVREYFHLFIAPWRIKIWLNCAPTGSLS